MSGAFPPPDLTGGERLGSVGRLLAAELEVVAGYFPEAELALLPAKRLLHARVVVARIPGAPRLGVNSVDRQMHVRVLLVAVRDHQDLVLLEPEIREHAIGDARNGGLVDRVAMIEGDGDVIDRLLHPIRLVRRRPHQDGRRAGIVRREVPRLDPIDPVGRRAVLPGLEIADEAGEAAPFRDLCDHPILRTSARISSRVVRNSSRVGRRPVLCARRASWLTLFPMRPSSTRILSSKRFRRALGTTPRETSRT